jgi:hypothetical protein
MYHLSNELPGLLLELMNHGNLDKHVNRFHLNCPDIWKPFWVQGNTNFSGISKFAQGQIKGMKSITPINQKN